jgi:hypothetical protein
LALSHPATTNTAASPVSKAPPRAFERMHAFWR